MALNKKPSFFKNFLFHPRATLTGYLNYLIPILSIKSDILLYRGHHVYCASININSLVVDLGGYRGEFSSEISNFFGCRCYVLEPSPDLFSSITDNPLIKKFNFAICSKPGPINFYLSDNPEASTIVKDIADTWPASRTIRVNGINFENFLKTNRIYNIDVLKVDIEGAEVEMFGSISDDTLSNIKQISIEFHNFVKGLKDIIRIKTRLRALGFLCIDYSRYNKDMLFINIHKVSLKWRKRVYMLMLEVIIFLTATLYGK